MVELSSRLHSAVPETAMYRSYGVPKRGHIPLRRLTSVSVYDGEGRWVKLDEIGRLGPFVATGVPVAGDRPVFKNGGQLVRLEAISEYSLEYPYGRQAVIWLKTAWAHYAVDSLSPEYVESGMADLFKEASVCGHVINAFINMTGNRSFNRVILKAQSLSGLGVRDFFDILSARRHFLLDQFAQQSLEQFTKSRVYKRLSEDDLWKPEKIRYLVAAVSHEATRQARVQVLTSSDEDAGVDAENRVSKSTSANNDSARTKIQTKPSAERQPDAAATTAREKGPHGFTIAPCTINWQTLQLPTEMALHFDCPFCCLTLRRVVEECSIVDLTIEHLQQHLQCNRFNEPVSKAAHSGTWPDISCRPRTRTIVLGALNIKNLVDLDSLPLCIADMI